jgi:hypothetical protein
MRLFFLFVGRNVNTHTQTQPKQKLFDVHFNAEATSSVSWIFVETLTNTYKLNLSMRLFFGFF